jgi:segregation and condensation protein B
MSLKAKFEAVIYAAEEPVTLAQLASLFASELAPEQPWQQDEPAPATDANSPAPDAVEVADAADATSPSEAAETMPPSPPPVGEAAVKAAAEAEAAAKEAAKAHTAAVRAENRKLRDAARVIVDELVADYANAERGIEMREVAGGYRLSTRPEYHDAVRMFVKSLKPALKLSLPALETLAVIAYKQPVTAPEIGEIRGVDASGVLGGLLARKLITTAGRKQVLGRPILYKTTKEFLMRFGLKDVAELPSLEEFEKLAAEVTLLEDAPMDEHEAAQEELALAAAIAAEPDVVESETAEPETVESQVAEAEVAETEEVQK